jgi:hypothetical protein
MPKDSVHAIPMTSINSATFVGTYKVIDPVGLPNECFLIRIVNDSDVDITVSYDGTNPHDYIPAGNNITLNLQTNARPANFIAQMKKGTKVWVKGSIGTGYVFLVGYYQEF